jgi:D-alanyl-D-alanine carboxypeptidase
MRVLACIAVLVVAAGCGGSAKQADRPGLQNVLHSLVTGRLRVAPGAVAYVSGPHGTWQGAAGWANVKGRVPMTVDARSRLGSVSKLWTAAVVLKLAEEHKLRLGDTVDRWLPGFFPYGKRITIRELLHQTSGMVDDNDIAADPKYWLARITDPQIRKELLAFSKRASHDPSVTVTSRFEMHIAAAIPLLFTPDTQYHYTNIGYKTLGVIAEKAGGTSLDSLYHRVIIDPLDLSSAGYDPTAEVAGEHATPYVVGNGGASKDATRLDMGGLSGSGGIVSDARDEAHFLTALMKGKIVSPALVRQLRKPYLAGYGYGTGVAPMCGDTVYQHGGATRATMAEAAVNGKGTRVVVLLLNGRTWNSWGDAEPPQALQKLYCAS